VLRPGRVVVVFSLVTALQGHAQSVRDSARVRIVDNRAPAWNASQRWEIATKPSLSIGLEDGDAPYLLSRVYSASRLANGQIVIGDSGSGELRFFDASGKFMRAAGRRGHGPGEFHEFSSLILCALPGKELFVADGGADRAHIYSITGEYKRTVTFQHEPGSSTPGIRACFADGTLLMRNVPVAVLQGEPGTLIRSTMQYFRYGADGRPLSKLAAVPDRTRYVTQHGNITHYPFVPFSPESQAAAGARTIYLNHSGLAEIEKRDPGGRLEGLIRWQAKRPRTSAVYRRFVEAHLAATSEQRRPPYAAFYAKTLPIPEFVPAVGQIIVDAIEHLWIKRYQLPWDNAADYDIFDPAGRWLGQVGAPSHVEIFQIDRDYILGKHRDELDVERIVIHSLNRRTRAR
jgi:6-bladed beta-propeller